SSTSRLAHWHRHAAATLWPPNWPHRARRGRPGFFLPVVAVTPYRQLIQARPHMRRSFAPVLTTYDHFTVNGGCDLHGLEIAQGIAAFLAWGQRLFDDRFETGLFLGRALLYGLVNLHIGALDHPAATHFPGG